MESAALLRRSVTVQIHTSSGVVDLGPWRVEPPTVRVAVAVLECAPVADPEGDDAASMAWDVLSAALASWLPAEMFERLAQSPRFLADHAPDLVWKGTPDALDPQTPARKAEQTVRRKAAAHSWHAVIAEYRAVLHAPDPWAELWPDFILQSMQLDRVRGKAALDAMYAALAGGGSEAAMESVLERAGWDVDHEMTDAEQLAVLEKLMRESGAAVPASPTTE